MIFTRRAVLAGGMAAFAAPALRGTTPSDVDIVRRAYTLLHPGLLRYNTPRQMEARFGRFAYEWGSSNALAPKYLALTRLLAGIKCGHSYANFYNQSDKVAGALFSGRNRLPFRFRWIGSEMVVTDGDLPRGTVVRSIDGRPTAMILNALLPLARADGANDAKRRQLLSVTGVDDYEMFDIYYPLLFPASDSFRIEASAPNGQPIHATLSAIDLKARQAARTTATPTDKNAPQWTIEHNGKTTVLTMDGWALYNSTWDWKGWLDQSFAEMDRRGTDRLIIDLRRNEGGLDCGHEIIARLIDTPLILGGFARRVRYRRVPDDLLPYCDTWDPSFKDWGADATPYDARFFNLKGDGDGPANIVPKGSRFKGRVFVLIGPENSSATFQFASLIKANKLGTLVGEPTGGNQRGINGGAFFFLRLPESGLEADIPLIGYFPDKSMPDAGITPDVLAPVTARDIASGRDAAMERALTV